MLWWALRLFAACYSLRSVPAYRTPVAGACHGRTREMSGAVMNLSRDFGRSELVALVTRQINDMLGMIVVVPAGH
jgi:hypothetical protein